MHTDCAIKVINKCDTTKCTVCLSKYKINIPCWRTLSGIIIGPVIDQRIYFPFHDLYYQPLMSKPRLIKYSGMDRLTMAIVYLQVDRVRELLQDKEILDNLPNYYFGYEGYKQTPIIALCTGNLPSNCHINFGDNLIKYMIIIKMLLATNKINLDHIDAFEKNHMDYIHENELDMLKLLF